MEALTKYSPGDVLHCAAWVDVRERLVEAVADELLDVQTMAVQYCWSLFADGLSASAVQSGELCTSLAVHLLRYHPAHEVPCSHSGVLDVEHTDAHSVLRKFRLFVMMLKELSPHLVYFPVRL